MQSATQEHCDVMGEAVAEFLRPRQQALHTFDWKITPAAIKAAVALRLLPEKPEGDVFSMTARLRAAVAERVRSFGPSDPKREDRLHELARFVVSDWGGLRRNSPKTLHGYVQRYTAHVDDFDAVTSARALHARVSAAHQSPVFPLEGIASWSKWLNFVWPEWALIYDARIAFALNAILLMRDIDAPAFPVPVGRNATLGHFSAQTSACLAWHARRGSRPPKSKAIATWMESAMVKDVDTYEYYLAVMNAAHRRLWRDEQTPLVHTEMLLFSRSVLEVVEDYVAFELTRHAQAHSMSFLGSEARAPRAAAPSSKLLA